MTLQFPNSPSTGQRYTGPNNLTYTWDGEKWITTGSAIANDGAAGVGYTYPGGVEQTVQSRLEQSVSVKDFGAVGDGVADDTAAIQAAISSTASASGHTVYFPPGIYRVTSSIIVDKQVSIIGSGQINTAIHRDFSVTADDVNDKQGIFNFVDGATGCTVRDLYLRSVVANGNGCLMSFVNTSSSFGQFYIDHVGMSTTVTDGYKWAIFADGRASDTSPIGIRGFDMVACSVFNGSVGCMRFYGVLKGSFIGGGVYTAGGTGTQGVRWDGTAAVVSQAWVYSPADNIVDLNFGHAKFINVNTPNVNNINNTTDTTNINVVCSALTGTQTEFWKDSSITSPTRSKPCRGATTITQTLGDLSQWDDGTGGIFIEGGVFGVSRVANTGGLIGEVGGGSSSIPLQTGEFMTIELAGYNYLFTLATGSGNSALLMASYTGTAIESISNQIGAGLFVSTDGTVGSQNAIYVSTNANSRVITITNKTPQTQQVNTQFFGTVIKQATYNGSL